MAEAPDPHYNYKPIGLKLLSMRLSDLATKCCRQLKDAKSQATKPKRCATSMHINFDKLVSSVTCYIGKSHLFECTHVLHVN